MKKIGNHIAAHLKRHYKKYLVELALLVPLLVMHSAVIFMVAVGVVALGIMLRDHVVRHAKRHGGKLALLLVLVSGVYLFGTFGYHQPGVTQPVGLTGTGSQGKLADPFAGRGVDDVTAAGVDQSGVGDCFDEAAEASEAASPEGRYVIYNGIKTTNVYTVTFKGAPNDHVVVTPADLALTWNSDEARDSALWARIDETAFLEWDHAEQFGTGIYSHQSGGIPDAGAVPPGGETQALALVTGQDVATESLSPVSGDFLTYHLGQISEANLNATLQSALSHGEAVTALSADASLAKLGFHNPGPLVEEHIWSVLEDENDEVIVRNPWGDNPSPFENVEPFPNDPAYQPVDGITSLPDGELEMSLPRFMGLYSDINFAGVDWWSNDRANVARDLSQGSISYFFADSLYTASDVTDHGFGNLGTHVWHGITRIGGDVASVF